ncbi:MAG TPA: pyridoxal phosphate-dependent aminotransferase [Phycisphaerales bacterium]|nr:pyridoxal phosphate-dependent aminotransferase [Phycisphaerales bacterium]
MPSLAARVEHLRPSVTVAFMNRAKAMQHQGLDVLSFAAGEPDFDTPRQIKDAAIEALLAGQTKYMPTFGDPETREVIARKLREENGIAGCTKEHVTIGAGGKHSLFVAIHCLFDQPRPGEAPGECILPVPAWVSYRPIVELAGGTIVEVPTTVETGFLASAEQIARAITPRTKLLILNSPCNPCGTMYGERQLRDIAAVVTHAAKTTAPDITILSDELYEKIVYGGIPHFSIGSVPEVAERTLTLNGLSKAYGMTGWRIGYTGASGDFGLRLTRAMATLQGQMSTNITSFTYPAIRVALTKCAAEVESMRRAFADRAQVMNKRLSSMPGLKTSRATGAFYAFPDISAHFGKTSPGGRPVRDAQSFCEALLEESLVALVPGDDFGGCGRNHVRISFACSEEQIERGMDRLVEFLTKLR